MITLVLNILGTALRGGAENLFLIEACWRNIDGLVSAMLTPEYSTGYMSSVRRAFAATGNHKRRSQVEKDTIGQVKRLTGYWLRLGWRMVVRKALW